MTKANGNMEARALHPRTTLLSFMAARLSPEIPNWIRVVKRTKL
jgi:hypothetical protein